MYLYPDCSWVNRTFVTTHVFATLFSFFFTLILQQKAPSVVKSLWSDEVEGQHVRIGDNSYTRDGTAKLEESAATFPYSHDVHAVSVRIWLCKHLFAVCPHRVCLWKASKIRPCQGCLFFRRSTRSLNPIGVICSACVLGDALFV